MISASNEPTEKRIADVIPSEIEICMAAIFNVPRGSDPRKLTSMPVKKIFRKCSMRRKYEEKSESQEVRCVKC
jgi:hypothetical protein